MNLIRASSVTAEARRKWYCRPRLLVGAALATFINTLLDTVAFALSPLAIIAPIGGVTLVVSVLFARTGCAGVEPVSLTQWLAIALILSGVLVVDVYGPQPPPVLNTTVVLSHFHSSSFELYQTVTCFAVVTMYACMALRCRVRPVGVTAAVTSAAVAGLCSGLCQTMLKVLATVTGAYLLHGTVPFGQLEFWQAMLELCGVALVLFHMLKICMGAASMALSSSLYQSSVMLFTIACSSSFLGELRVASPGELALFLLGTGNVLGGLQGS